MDIFINQLQAVPVAGDDHTLPAIVAANADPEIDALVAQRTAAKKARDFATADRIRDELKAMGVEIIDTPQGTKWKKV